MARDGINLERFNVEEPNTRLHLYQSRSHIPRIPRNVDRDNGLGSYQSITRGLGCNAARREDGKISGSITAAPEVAFEL